MQLSSRLIALYERYKESAEFAVLRILRAGLSEEDPKDMELLEVAGRALVCVKERERETGERYYEVDEVALRTIPIKKQARLDDALSVLLDDLGSLVGTVADLREMEGAVEQIIENDKQNDPRVPRAFERIRNVSQQTYPSIHLPPEKPPEQPPQVVSPPSKQGGDSTGSPRLSPSSPVTPKSSPLPAAGEAFSTEMLRFTVVGPSVFTPGKDHSLSVWMHLEEQSAQMAQRAMQQQGGGREPTPTSASTSLLGGTHFSVGVQLSGLTVKTAELPVVWAGQPVCVSFSVRVASGAFSGCHPGLISIRVGGRGGSGALEPLLLFSRIRIMVEVGRKEERPAYLPARELRPRKVLLSYAPQDRNAVVARVQAMKKVDPQLTFLDIVPLRTGSRWRESLAQAILNSDMLFLFWSRNALATGWIHWEWRTALALQGIDGIDLVPLASFQDAPPPRELVQLLPDNEDTLATPPARAAREPGALNQGMEGPTQGPAGSMPCLVVLRGLRRGQIYPLQAGQNLVGLASEPGVSVDLSQEEPRGNARTSPRHAVITLDGGRAWIEDVNSTLGTFVNMERVEVGQKALLEANDTVHIGTLQFRFLV